MRGTNPSHHEVSFWRADGSHYVRAAARLAAADSAGASDDRRACALEGGRNEARHLAHAAGADRGRLRDRVDLVRAALGARTVPHAALVRPRLGPRRVLVRHRDPEPALGLGPAV